MPCRIKGDPGPGFIVRSLVPCWKMRGLKRSPPLSITQGPNSIQTLRILSTSQMMCAESQSRPIMSWLLSWLYPFRLGLPAPLPCFGSPIAHFLVTSRLQHPPKPYEYTHHTRGVRNRQTGVHLDRIARASPALSTHADSGSAHLGTRKPSCDVSLVPSDRCFWVLTGT